MKRRKKKKNNFLKILLVIILIGSGYFFVNRNFAESNFDIPENLISSTGENNWWNSEFAYRRKIETNSLKGYLELNHAELTIARKSNIDGSDIRIVGEIGGKYSEINYFYDRFDSIRTKIGFDAKSLNYNNYYIYYGNIFLDAKKYSNSELNDMRLFNGIFKLGEEEKSSISILGSRKWLLKDSDDIRNFRIRIESNATLEGENYLLLNNDSATKRKIEISNDESYINLSELKSGTHSIFLVNKNAETVKRSNTIKVNISNPIYVAWTLDWEGIDPKQEFLDMIAEISSEYSIKLTHFFNPRILINSSISQLRKRELVEWVKKRNVNFGEEIAMHMHMHFDLVEEAGVKAKYNAKTWDKGSSGFDVPATEYSYDEYLKMLKWGLEKLKENGIDNIIGYRAGGWFANLETLRAIQDAGFKYDSSARPSFQLGQNKLSQEWDLSSNAQPYLISKTNQNRTGSDNFNLLEIPNNGLDSYWSKADDMIQAFYDNYTPGTTADFSRIIVYLSHPEWFNIDDPKLRDLFDEVNNYRSDLDKGPVKFVTLKEWMELEDKI